MDTIKENIFIMNRHWEGEYYEFPIKREIFSKLIQYLEQPLILSITGPRRVGKTVLMKQMINYLIEKGFPKRNILFFSFDEYKGDPIKIIKNWESIIGKKIRGKTYFLFLDEIQNINNWAEKIKVLYDNINIKIIISGSSSMSLKKGSESLAGRIKEFYINPLSYKEYLSLSGISKSKIKETEWENYKIYMRRQLPELAIFNILDPNDYIKTIVKKIIYEDIKKYFHVEETETIESIFKIICKDPGQIISITDLSKDFGISRITISRYLEALEKSYLIRKIYNFSNNPRKSEIRLKKYYPYYTNLIAYVVNTDFGKIAETEVAWKLDAKYFWNNRGKEIDFIINKCGIEVKMRKIIEYKDVKWLFNNKLNLKEKYLITHPFSVIKIKEKINAIPLNKIDEFANHTLQKC